MTKRAKPNLWVTTKPVDPTALPDSSCSQADAERMLSTQIDAMGEDDWAPVFHAHRASLRDAIRAAAQGDSERAKSTQQLHPSTTPERNNLDLRIEADAGIRQYVKWCKQEGKSPDPLAIAYLRDNPKPPTRPRGKRPSHFTEQKMLELAARVHQRLKKEPELSLSAAATAVLTDIQDADGSPDLRTTLSAARMFNVSRATVDNPSPEVELELRRIELAEKL